MRIVITKFSDGSTTVTRLTSECILPEREVKKNLFESNELVWTTNTIKNHAKSHNNGRK